MSHLSLNSPLGPLTVFEEDGLLVSLDWGRAPVAAQAPTLLLKTAKDQLDAYFEGRLTIFDLPLAPAATRFQTKIRHALQDIPYGKVLTYGELARRLGSAPRAVGGACGANPLPLIVPCHRVVGANGRMTGYSGGGGLATKEALLRLEGALP
ncbi:MAG: methylated-DNA--[protein]-cysteine S-methyltransferase [Magnetospirillum sp. WYHS-4]